MIRINRGSTAAKQRNQKYSRKLNSTDSSIGRSKLPEPRGTLDRVTTKHQSSEKSSRTGIVVGAGAVEIADGRGQGGVVQEHVALGRGGLVVAVMMVAAGGRARVAAVMMVEVVMVARVGKVLRAAGGHREERYVRPALVVHPDRSHERHSAL